jgi:hypothetical protein
MLSVFTNKMFMNEITRFHRWGEYITEREELLCGLDLWIPEARPFSVCSLVEGLLTSHFSGTSRLPSKEIYAFLFLKYLLFFLGLIGSGFGLFKRSYWLENL